VAGRAIVRAQNMRGRLRRRIEGRARDVANAAVSRRPFENCVQVARLARQVAMHTVEFEAGGQVVEGHRDRRRAGRFDLHRRRERQQRRGEQARDPSQFASECHVY
jgi:hypothetical protein